YIYTYTHTPTRTHTHTYTHTWLKSTLHTFQLVEQISELTRKSCPKQMEKPQSNALTALGFALCLFLSSLDQVGSGYPTFSDGLWARRVEKSQASEAQA